MSYNDSFINLIGKYILITTARGNVLFKCTNVLGFYHEFKTDINWLDIECHIYKHSWQKDHEGRIGRILIFPDGRDWKILTEEEFKVEVI